MAYANKAVDDVIVADPHATRANLLSHFEIFLGGGLYTLRIPLTLSLKGAWFQPLSLSSEKPVSKFSFKWVNLCRYTPAR